MNIEDLYGNTPSLHIRSKLLLYGFNLPFCRSSCLREVETFRYLAPFCRRSFDPVPCHQSFSSTGVPPSLFLVSADPFPRYFYPVLSRQCYFSSISQVESFFPPAIDPF